MKGLGLIKVQEKLGQAAKDALWFLVQIASSAPEAIPHLSEVETLRTVLAQQFPKGPSGPPAQRRPTGGEVIESPHEPEARYGKKRGKTWLGSKAQGTA